MLTVGITAIGGGVAHNVMAALRDCPFATRIVGFDASPWGAGVWECDVAHRVPLADDPDYVPVLMDRCRQEGVQLLIPGSDPELLPLALAADAFQAQGCRVLVSSPECVRICRDKLATYQALAPLGVPFVTTWSFEEAMHQSETLPYPLIAKPRGGSASRGLVILMGPQDWEQVQTNEPMVVQPYLMPAVWQRDPDQLAAAMAQLEHTRQPLQQEIHAMQLTLSSEGELLGVYDGINLHRAGVPVETRAVNLPHIQAACEALAKALAPRGLRVVCNAQGFDTCDGLRFFELNPRFSGGTHLRTLLGYREVEAVVRHYGLGQDGPSVRPLLSARTDWVALRQTHAHDVVVPLSSIERFCAEGRVQGAASPRPDEQQFTI
jgi:carbamoyl-phosphate synthase large subunit